MKLATQDEVDKLKEEIANLKSAVQPLEKNKE